MIKAANNFPVAYVECRDDLQEVKFSHHRMSSDEARRIAKAIARIPEFMMQRAGFHSRGSGKRWRASHPFHVALEDMFVRGHWDNINTLCRFNSIPLDPTGERIQTEGLWNVYEFAVQMDAIMFWDEFKGRWLQAEKFVYPDRPENLPRMRKPPGWDKVSWKVRRD